MPTDRQILLADLRDLHDDASELSGALDAQLVKELALYQKFYLATAISFAGQARNTLALVIAMIEQDLEQ